MICHACTMEENSSLGPGCLISKNEMPFCDKRTKPEAQRGWGTPVNVGAHGPLSSQRMEEGHHLEENISKMVPWPVKPRTDGAKHISMEVYLGSCLLPPPLQCKKCFLFGRISDSPSSPARFDRSLFTIPPPLLTHQHQHFSPTLWDGDHSPWSTYVPPDHVLLLDKDHTPHMAVTPAPSLGPTHGQSSSKQGWLH